MGGIAIESFIPMKTRKKALILVAEIIASLILACIIVPVPDLLQIYLVTVIIFAFMLVISSLIRRRKSG